MAAAHTLVLILKDFYQGFSAHLEALLSPWLLHSAPPTVTRLTVVTVLPESGSINNPSNKNSNSNFTFISDSSKTLLVTGAKKELTYVCQVKNETQLKLSDFLDLCTNLGLYAKLVSISCFQSPKSTYSNTLDA